MPADSAPSISRRARCTACSWSAWQPTESAKRASRRNGTRLEGWTWKCDVARDVGINPVPNIIYSVSPKHTDEYFAERTRQTASTKSHPPLPKRPRRTAHAGASANFSADHVRERQRHSARTAHSLHHRPRSALLPRSRQARHQDRKHGIAAARRRLIEPFALQRRKKPPRPGL